MTPEPRGRYGRHGHCSPTAATSSNVIFHPGSVLGNDCACQQWELTASSAVLCITAADGRFVRVTDLDGVKFERPLRQIRLQTGKRPYIKF